MFAVIVKLWIRFIYVNNMVIGGLAITLAVSKNMPNTLNLHAIDLITIPCTDDETAIKSTIISNVSVSGLYPSLTFNPLQNRLYFINNDVIFSVSLNGSFLRGHGHETKIAAFDLDIERQLLICASAALASLGPNKYFLEQSKIGSNFKETIISNLATVVTVIVDAVNQRVFWRSISYDSSIESISYDGSNRIKHVSSLMAPLLNVDPYSKIIYYSKFGSLRYQSYNGSEIRTVRQSVNALVCFSTGDILFAHGNKLKLFNSSIDDGALTIYSDIDNNVNFNKISVISDCPVRSTSDPFSLEMSTIVTEHRTILGGSSTTSPSTYSIILTETGTQSQTDRTPKKAPMTYSSSTIAIIVVSVLAVSLIAIAVTLTLIAKRRKSTKRTNSSIESLYEYEM